MYTHRNSTLRLPAPPLPPKPLHLTLRGNGAAGANSGQRNPLPSWSRAGSVLSSAHGPPGFSEDSTDDEWTSCTQNSPTAESSSLPPLETLDSVPLLQHRGRKYRRSQSRRSASGATSQGEPTLRRKGDSKRQSIFFDALLPNPLMDPSVSTTHLPIPVVDDRELLRVETLPESDNLLELPTKALEAVSLHSFVGQTEYGELSFGEGTSLLIEVEDLGGGWSLGYEESKGETGRGLIPRGWYAVGSILIVP